MTYDYAKLETLNTQRGTRKGLYIGIVVVMLFSIFGIMYLYGSEKNQKSMVVAEHISEPSAIEKKTSVIPEPEFAFYTILPNTEIKSPSAKNTQNTVSQNISAPSASASSSTHTALAKGKMYVQVALCKENADADKLKAHLSLLGFDCQVRLGKIHEPGYYRVIIGPFSNEKEALDAQQTLSEHHFDRGMVLKMPA